MFFFFDWADPPTLIAKASLYLSKDSTDIFQFVADCFMGVFVVMFIETRNIVFVHGLYLFLEFSL